MFRCIGFWRPTVVKIRGRPGISEWNQSWTRPPDIVPMFHFSTMKIRPLCSVSCLLFTTLLAFNGYAATPEQTDQRGLRPMLKDNIERPLRYTPDGVSGVPAVEQIRLLRLKNVTLRGLTPETIPSVQGGVFNPLFWTVVAELTDSGRLPEESVRVREAGPTNEPPPVLSGQKRARHRSFSTSASC